MNRQMRRMMERSQREQQKRRDNQMKQSERVDLVTALYILTADTLGDEEFFGKRPTINTHFIVRFLKKMEDKAAMWSNRPMEIMKIRDEVAEKTGLKINFPEEGDE